MIVKMTSSSDGLSTNVDGSSGTSIPNSMITPSRTTATQHSSINASKSSLNRRNGSHFHNNSTKSSKHSAPPGILSLMEQGDWKAVRERARKYPKECQVWARMKKSSLRHPFTGGNSNCNTNNSGSRSTSGSESLSRDREPSPCSSSCLSGNSSMSFSMSYSMNQDGSNSGSIPNSTNGTSISSMYNSGNNHNKQASARSFVSMESQTTQATTSTIPSGNISSIRCKALHHACHKLRSIHSIFEQQLRDFERMAMPAQSSSLNNKSRVESASPTILKSGEEENTHPNICSTSSILNSNFHTTDEYVDPWIEACKAILTLIEVYPEAASDRESRHGCLPLHLASFALRETPTPSSTLLNLLKLKEQQDHHGSTFDYISPRCVMGIDPIHVDFTSQGTSKMFQYEFVDDKHNIGPSTSSQTNMKEESTRFSNKFVDDDIRNLLERVDYQQQQGSDISNSTSRRPSCNLSRQERPPSISRSTSREVSNGSTTSLSSRASETSFSVVSHLSSHTQNSTSQKSSLHLSLKNNHNKNSKHLPPFNIRQYMANHTLRNEYSHRVIEALLDAYPKGARVESEGGRYPLHIALSGKATLPVIQKLLSAYPDATRRRNQQGELPIHLVAKYGESNEDVAPTLLRAHPFGAEGMNRWERTPLQESLAMAGENGRMYQVELVAALRRHPTQWMADIRKGFLWKFPHLEEMNEILDDNENDSKNINDGAPRGDLFKLDSIQFRSAENEAPTPRRFKRRNLERLDLFYLIQSKQWNLLVSKLEYEPIEAKKRQKKRNRAGYISDTPALHFACQFYPPDEAIDALVAAHPKAIYKPVPPYGQLPIHYASTWGAPIETFDLLIAECPSSVREKDYLGNLPLHCACFAGTHEHIVETLLCAYPRGVMERNGEGSTPIDLVRRLSHPHRNTLLHMMEQVSLEWLEKDRQVEDKRTIKNRNDHDVLITSNNTDSVQNNLANGKTKKGWNVGRGRRRFGRKKVEEVVIKNHPPKVNIIGSNSIDGSGIEAELADNGDSTVLWV